MYRFLVAPRWVGFHLLVVVGIVVMVNLGFWQLRRLDERQSFNDAVGERAAADVVALEELLPPGDDPTDLDDLEWRRVTVTGTYVPDGELRVVNRSQRGQAGDMIVTPLELNDGRVLLVERGFVPLGDVEAEAPPDGEVTVTGRLRASAERGRGQLSDPAEGDLVEVQRIDIARLAGQLPGDPVPMYVELVASEPAETGPYPIPGEPPELSDGPHLAYAVQWFIFSGCVAIGWVLAVRHSLRSRRSAEAAEAGGG